MSTPARPSEAVHRPPVLTRLVTWFLGASASSPEPDLPRRAGVLLTCTAFFIVACLATIATLASVPGRTVDIVTLIAFCGLITLNPWLLRRGAPVRLAGALLVAEVMFGAAFLSSIDGGMRDPAFLVNFLVPWLAAVLIGPIYGFVAAGVVTLEVIAVYLLEVNGRPFASSLPPLLESQLWALEITVILFAIALLAWVYEAQTLRNLRQSHDHLERAHEDLARSERRFRAVVQHSSDAVLLLEKSGLVRYASPSTEHVIAYLPEQLLGLNAFSFLHPTDRRSIRRWLLQRLASPAHGTAYTLTPPFRVRRPAGSWHWCEATVEDLRHEPAVGAFVAHLRDITERKRAERALRRARDEAEALARLRAVFLANMSHEIRTPLTGIIGFSSVLAAEAEPHHQEFAQLIERSGRRLLGTLNSVLDLAQLEAGQLRPTDVPIDAVAEAGEVLRLLRPLADSKALWLTLHAPAAPVFVSTDAVFVHRILNNLVGNAIKFTERGGIDVTLEVTGATVLLVVRDTGIGITKGFQPHLFDEFAQASTGLARSHEGNGLGLAITKRLVDLLGGKISVESTPGVGSVFTVALPQRILPEPALAAAGAFTDDSTGNPALV